MCVCGGLIQGGHTSVKEKVGLSVGGLYTGAYRQRNMVLTQNMC